MYQGLVDTVSSLHSWITHASLKRGRIARVVCCYTHFLAGVDDAAAATTQDCIAFGLARLRHTGATIIPRYTPTASLALLRVHVAIFMLRAVHGNRYDVFAVKFVHAKVLSVGNSSRSSGRIPTVKIFDARVCSFQRSAPSPWRWEVGRGVSGGCRSRSMRERAASNVRKAYAIHELHCSCCIKLVCVQRMLRLVERTVCKNLPSETNIRLNVSTACV